MWERFQSRTQKYFISASVGSYTKKYIFCDLSFFLSKPRIKYKTNLIYIDINYKYKSTRLCQKCKLQQDGKPMRS